ncbi:condensation domain-containing protein [Bacillus sp. CB102A.1]
MYFEDNLTGNDRIFWVIHHLVVDGVSWRILLEDLQVVYNQMKQGQEVRYLRKVHLLKSGLNDSDVQ